LFYGAITGLQGQEIKEFLKDEVGLDQAMLAKTSQANSKNECIYYACWSTPFQHFRRITLRNSHRLRSDHDKCYRQHNEQPRDQFNNVNGFGKRKIDEHHFFKEPIGCGK